MSGPLYPAEDFGEAFDAAAARLRAAVAAACARPRPWPACVCAAIDAALEFAAADPAAARLLLVEPWAHGAAGTARRGLLLSGFAAQLAAGCEETPGTVELPGLTEQMLVASLAALLAKRLHGEPGGAAELSTLAPELTEFVLLHYLGPARARLWARRSRVGPERPAEIGETDAVRHATFAEVLGMLQGMIGVDVQVVVNLLGGFFDCGFHARLERVETLASGDGPVLVVFAGAQGIALDPAEVESFLGRLPGAPGSEWIELDVAKRLRVVIEPLADLEPE